MGVKLDHSHLGRNAKLRVFKNKLLRRLFGPMTYEVIGEWRKLHNEELYVLYSSPNIIWLVKPRIRWAEHVARIREGRGKMHTEFWWGNLREETTWKAQS